jgi:hypothetical protein
MRACTSAHVRACTRGLGSHVFGAHVTKEDDKGERGRSLRSALLSQAHARTPSPSVCIRTPGPRTVTPACCTRLCRHKRAGERGDRPAVRPPDHHQRRQRATSANEPSTHAVATRRSLPLARRTPHATYRPTRARWQACISVACAGASDGGGGAVAAAAAVAGLAAHRGWYRMK